MRVWQEFENGKDKRLGLQRYIVHTKLDEAEDQQKFNCSQAGNTKNYISVDFLLGTNKYKGKNRWVRLNLANLSKLEPKLQYMALNRLHQILLFNR